MRQVLRVLPLVPPREGGISTLTMFAFGVAVGAKMASIWIELHLVSCPPKGQISQFDLTLDANLTAPPLVLQQMTTTWRGLSQWSLALSRRSKILILTAIF
jgi:hypothetical protein